MGRLAKIAIGLLLGLGLSGCIDASLDVALTSEATASATLTQVMRSDSYTSLDVVDTLGQAEWEVAIKAVGDAMDARIAAEKEGKDASDIVVPPLPGFYDPLAPKFCTSGRFLKRVDGGATCMDSSEGSFADIQLGELEDQLTFTPQGDGTVRIALSTAQLVRAVRPQVALTLESDTIVPALFKDRKITLKFSGDLVTETNMKLAKDEKSASQDIFILNLLSGTAQLPAEFYAVVRAP